MVWTWRLSFAQVDARGSVKINRFGGRVIGTGGFQNIAQNAKRVIFGGTFTAGNLRVSWHGGRTVIEREGKHSKFLAELEQVSYNGQHAWEGGQEILFGSEWEDAACGPYDRNLAENWLSVPICHLSQFGVFGKTTASKIYLPLVLRNSP